MGEDLRGGIRMLKLRQQPGVQPLPPCLQQAVVGRVTDQSVLEGIARLGRRAAPEDELGRGQSVEADSKGSLGSVSNRRQQGVIEFAAECRQRSGRSP
jgi:hypothetical protein